MARALIQVGSGNKGLAQERERVGNHGGTGMGLAGSRTRECVLRMLKPEQWTSGAWARRRVRGGTDGGWRSLVSAWWEFLCKKIRQLQSLWSPAPEGSTRGQSASHNRVTGKTRGVSLLDDLRAETSWDKKVVSRTALRAGYSV